MTSDAETAKRINFNTISAVVFTALGIVLFLIIPHHIDKPLINLGGAGQSNLDAEAFPQMVAGMFVLLGAWYLFVSFSLREHNELRDLNVEAVTNVVVTLVIMAAYVWLMLSLGFVAGSAIMIFTMSTYFGNRNFVLGALVSIVVPLVVFVLFTKPLVTSLPPFPVDELIPESSIIYKPIKYLSNRSIF
ncbi:MAG: tripartite tricarboxylate transporter TctB family protein [Gammaproteobacteria bacterium]|nr:tripartite tricarboxylate transporter TctB family protein [Gammaproteobacteria bacterium]MDH3412188.1 tripartite tricarboxylate transporter TctB family protein [Gammaproteobacteria bacterium]